MLILASNSPRRKELLSLVFDEFSIAPPTVDESLTEGVLLDKIPEYLADKKAAQIASLYPEDIVLGCDTGVFLDNQMIGKPQSDQAAYQILKLLSGRTHRVITGCAIYCRNRRVTFSESTEVEFYPLSDKEIRDYIMSGEPADKAGAYGIQGKGAVLVKKINGDYCNVVGLPLARLVRELKKLEIDINTP